MPGRGLTCLPPPRPLHVCAGVVLVDGAVDRETVGGVGMRRRLIATSMDMSVGEFSSKGVYTDARGYVILHDVQLTGRTNLTWFGALRSPNATSWWVGGWLWGGGVEHCGKASVQASPSWFVLGLAVVGGSLSSEGLRWMPGLWGRRGGGGGGDCEVARHGVSNVAL